MSFLNEEWGDKSLFLFVIWSFSISKKRGFLWQTEIYLKKNNKIKVDKWSIFFDKKPHMPLILREISHTRAPWEVENVKEITWLKRTGLLNTERNWEKLDDEKACKWLTAFLAGGLSFELKKRKFFVYWLILWLKGKKNLGEEKKRKETLFRFETLKKSKQLTFRRPSENWWMYLWPFQN